jgi:hypothetical protein
MALLPGAQDVQMYHPTINTYSGDHHSTTFINSMSSGKIFPHSDKAG